MVFSINKVLSDMDSCSPDSVYYLALVVVSFLFQFFIGFEALFRNS